MQIACARKNKSHLQIDVSGFPFKGWAHLGLNQGPPDYELSKIQFILNWFDLICTVYVYFTLSLYSNDFK